jgi:hypothetical protein
MKLAVVEESQFYVMYVEKCLIYYLNLVDTGTESVGQRQEKGVHVDSLLELVVRRSEAAVRPEPFAQIYGEINKRRQFGL